MAGLHAPAGVNIIKHGRFVVDTLQRIPPDVDAKKTIDAVCKLEFINSSEELERGYQAQSHISMKNALAQSALKHF